MTNPDARKGPSDRPKGSNGTRRLLTHALAGALGAGAVYYNRADTPQAPVVETYATTEGTSEFENMVSDTETGMEVSHGLDEAQARKKIRESNMLDTWKDIMTDFLLSSNAPKLNDLEWNHEIQDMEKVHRIGVRLGFKYQEQAKDYIRNGMKPSLALRQIQAQEELEKSVKNYGPAHQKTILIEKAQRKGTLPLEILDEVNAEATSSNPNGTIGEAEAKEEREKEGEENAQIFKEKTMKLIEERRFDPEFESIAKSCLLMILAEDGGPMDEEELRDSLVTFEHELDVFATFKEMRNKKRQAELLDLVRKGAYPTDALLHEGAKVKKLSNGDNIYNFPNEEIEG